MENVYVPATKQEEIIANAAYEMADMIYNINKVRLSNLNIDKDNFMQNAAIYILKKYREGWFDRFSKLNLTNPKGPIYNALNGRFLLNEIIETEKELKEPESKDFKKIKSKIRKLKKQEKEKKELGQSTEKEKEELIKLRKELKKLAPKDIRVVSLDINDKDSHHSPSSIKHVPSVYTIKDEINPNPEEAERLEYGKEVFEVILEELNKEPYKTSKHVYTNKDNKELMSEYEIGQLLYMGNKLDQILKIYDVYTDNIGASSVATFVNRKVKQVIDKIAEAINSLPEYERNAVKEFVLTI